MKRKLYFTFLLCLVSNCIFAVQVYNRNGRTNNKTSGAILFVSDVKKNLTIHTRLASASPTVTEWNEDLVSCNVKNTCYNFVDSTKTSNLYSDYLDNSSAQSTEKIFEVVEKQPAFNGNLYQWLSQNMQYPAYALENGIEGKVFLRFIVEKDGSITNVEVVRSSDPSLEKEAVRLVNSMPKWRHGINVGQPVRVKYNLVIPFKIR